ncbi:DNA-binding protein, partial [Streptomyces sp. NTH33]
PDELRLLRALTEHSRIPDIAQAARIAPGDAKERITDLVLAARAGDTTNLIVLAHAWNLLSADRSTVTPEGASR